MKPTKPVKSFKHKEAKRAHIPSAEEAGYEACFSGFGGFLHQGMTDAILPRETSVRSDPVVSVLAHGSAREWSCAVGSPVCLRMSTRSKIPRASRSALHR